MLSNNDLDFLKECLPFYEKLDNSDRQLLVSSVRQSHYKKGDNILADDKECSGLILVKNGQIRAFFESVDGKEITLYRLLSNDICILSASCVLKNITFDVMLEVEKDSLLYFIPSALWGGLVRRNILIKEFSMELVSERFSEVMWVMEQMVSKNMGQRVASFLLEQAALEEDDKLTITHDVIAKNLGTAREVISRLLKYFEDEGLIKLARGRVYITDRKKLTAAAR